jgi:hypothetical protein
VLESLALEKFHGDEGTAFEFSDIVDGANIGVIESGGGAGFATESLDGLGIVRDVVGKEFQSDAAAEADVLGFVNHAHATATEFFEDTVVRDGAAEDGGGFGHRAGSLTQRLRASKCGKSGFLNPRNARGFGMTFAWCIWVGKERGVSSG